MVIKYFRSDTLNSKIKNLDFVYIISNDSSFHNQNCYYKMLFILREKAYK